MFQYRNHVNGQKKLQRETTKSLINVEDNNRSSGEESRSVATNCSHIPACSPVTVWRIKVSMKFHGSNFQNI